MTSVSFASAVRQRLHRFAADQEGVSAIEFAMLLPLMLTLYLGGVEISQAVSADRKTTLVAHTVGDLIAQVTCVSSADMTNVFNAAQAVVYPFSTSNLKVTATRVDIDANGNATVGWTATFNGGASTRSGNVTANVPSVLRTANLNASLIWAEAAYAYTPTIGYGIVGNLTLNEKIFMVPRLSTTVAYPTCS